MGICGFRRNPAGRKNYGKSHKNSARIRRKIRVLPCGEPARRETFPQVFPATSPQPVDKSVDFSPTMWKNPRGFKLFRGFSGLKSYHGIVDKYHLVIYPFSPICGESHGQNLQKSRVTRGKPSSRILVNVPSVRQIVLAISNDVLLIASLKNHSANFLVTKPFECGYDVGEHFVRRGRRPRRPATLGSIFARIQKNHRMDVIRHYDITVNFDSGNVFTGQKIFFNDFTIRR